MFSERTSVGLDVHARSIFAAGIDNITGEVFKTRLVPSNQTVVEWLGTLPSPVAVAYEAGPTGFGLARALARAGVACTVAAPSKIVRAPGDRVKTDARDAVLLARLLRMGELVAVRVPHVHEEAARDLVRAREDVRGDLMRARHRVSKMLLRYGYVYCGGPTWNSVHHAWLDKIVFDDPASQAAYEAELETVRFARARRDRLDKKIAETAASPAFADAVHRLWCLRGVSVLTAFALTVEIGDWTRFTGSSVGAFLGLVPSEHSSGSTRRLGSITKSGNSHARRLLVEAAWHHKPRYRVGATLQARWDQAPAQARIRADQGNRRLHQRWVSLSERGKKLTVANTAIARELAGWCWSLATLDG